MKKILTIIALVGLTAATYAQDNKCAIVKKKTHHRAAHKATVKTWSNFPENACMIDSNGDIQYITGNTYTGNYPPRYSTNCDMHTQMKCHYKDLVVTSTAFVNNGALPAKYTCKGQAASPPLNVTNIPAGAKSLAVVMFDPHATAKRSTTNWLVWNLDPDGNIPENFATDHMGESPITHQYGYQGACAVQGTHYYHIRVYALDTKLLLDRHTTKTVLEKTMQGHVLAKGEIVCESNKLTD